MKKNKEIKHYVVDYHPVLDYIEKKYFPKYNEIRQNQLDFAIKQKGKGNPGLIKNFQLQLNEEITFNINLSTQFNKKVEEDKIIIVETNTLSISSHGVFGYLLSDTGNLTCLGTNNYQYNEQYKKEVYDLVFGNYFLNQRLSKLPEKKKEKTVKI